MGSGEPMSLPCFYIHADTQWLASTITLCSAHCNVLVSNEIIKVKTAFQGISVNVTDMDVLFIFSYLSGRKIKI